MLLVLSSMLYAVISWPHDDQLGVLGLHTSGTVSSVTICLIVLSEYDWVGVSIGFDQLSRHMRVIADFSAYQFTQINLSH
jgi:hypothetical protein